MRRIEKKEARYKVLYANRMDRAKYEKYFYSHRDTLNESYGELMNGSKQSENYYEDRAKKLIDKYGSMAV